MESALSACILITLLSLGPLLTLVDLIGTIVKAALGYFHHQRKHKETIEAPKN